MDTSKKKIWILDDDKSIRWVLQKALEKNKIKFVTRSERKVIFHKKLHHTVLNLSIIDNGPGILKEKIEEIFFPLVSGKDAGTGLGLPLSQNFITLHNGIIDVISRPGETEFKILLPIQN